MTKQKKVTVAGKEYTLQHPGVRWQLQLQDRMANGNSPTETYATEVLEHVVINPKVTIDDFESFEELDLLVKEIRPFLRTGK